MKRGGQYLIVHELTIQKVCTMGIRIGFKVLRLIHPWVIHRVKIFCSLVKDLKFTN